MANGKPGPPKGNKNAIKNKAWADALRRELTGNQNADKLRQLAVKVYEAALEGESWAVKEIGDRLDGKPVQSVEGTGPDGAMIIYFTNDDESVL